MLEDVSSAFNPKFLAIASLSTSKLLSFLYLIDVDTISLYVVKNSLVKRQPTKNI